MKTKILGIVAVLFAVFLMADVYAYSSYEGVFYEDQKIEGVYFYKHREDTKSEKYTYHNFHSQAAIIRDSITNDIVYCVESWAPVSGATPGSYKFTGKSPTKGLSYSNAKRVEALAYYGYGYYDKKNKIDHTDLKWYAVTQYMIWLVTSPKIEHYFVSSIDSTTPIYPFEDEIKELNELVNRDQSWVLVQDYETKKYLIVDKTSEIRDENDVMSEFPIISSDTLNIHHINHRELAISASTLGSHYLHFEKSYKKFEESYAYYISDDYQDMLKPGNLDYREQDIEFIAEKGNDEVFFPPVEPDDGKGDEIKVPVEPETPEVPEEPIVPVEPETPELPEEPIVPIEPETPIVPTNPETPEEEDKEIDDTMNDDKQDSDNEEKVEFPDEPKLPEDNNETVEESKGDLESDDKDNELAEKEELDSEVINNYLKPDNLNVDNSEYSPISVKVPATGKSALSVIFCLVSVLGLFFVKYGK